MEHRVCPWWMAYTFDNPLRRLVHPPKKLLGPWLAPGMTVLDVGCGMGGFSLAMARMLGGSGQVISVDLQQKMLDILEKRARKAGLINMILPRLCTPDSLNLSEPLDFALAFFMVHETPDQKSFFSQLHAVLKPGARIFMAEPQGHVSKDDFQQSLATAEITGLKLLERPRVRLAHAAVLEKQ